MPDLKLLQDKIDKGLARVVEITDENIIVAHKQFDMEKAKLGELVELPEEIEIVVKSQLEEEKATHLEEAKTITDFLKNTVV